MITEDKKELRHMINMAICNENCRTIWHMERIQNMKNKINGV